jgi:hypothetical protein
MAKSTEQSKSSPDPADVVREPWRCQGCRSLMYNIDRKGYPAPGAPTPKFFDPDYSDVCWMCFIMLCNIRESQYLRVAHQRWQAAQERAKKTGDDYFRTQ